MKVGIYDIGKVCDISIKERFEIYKKCGFEYVGFYMDNSYIDDGEDYIDMLHIAKDVGLKIDQLHLDYKMSNMMADTMDNDYIRYIIDKINEAKLYNIPYLVLHASMGNTPPDMSEYMPNRLYDIDKLLDDSDTKLCFENVRCNNNLDKIMDINLSNFGICFDSGHANCYSDSLKFLEKYSDKILCTHLHDNMGTDTHDIIFNGNIDWSKVYPLIERSNRGIDYLECFPPRGAKLNRKEFVEFVQNCYNRYVKLGEYNER